MKKSILFAAGILCLLLISCENKIKPEMPAKVFMNDAAVSFNTNATSMKKASNGAMKQARAFSTEESVEMEMDTGAGEIVRKLIKNGNIDIEVESFDGLEESIKNFVKSFGGYIVNTYSNENYYNASIKVPEAYFDEAMDQAGLLGKVKGRSENSQDVTDEYYDLESRIETKRILKDKLEGYLKQSNNLKDLLEVERQLNEVISELESYEGRMKRLSKQIEYSTINLNVNLPYGYRDTGFEWPDLGEKFRELGSDTVGFFANFLFFLFYIVIYGLPIIALCALIYWLCFGKVGLLVKLFKKLSKKK